MTIDCNRLCKSLLESAVDTYTIEEVCNCLTAICLEKADKINRQISDYKEVQTASYWNKLARRFQGQK